MSTAYHTLAAICAALTLAPAAPAGDKGLGVRIIVLDDGDAASLGEAIRQMFPRVAPNPIRLVLPGKTLETPAAKDGALPVTLTATGSKLIVASDDPRALDLVGKMARMLDSAEQMSELFFPLQHAPAKDVARILDALFNGSPEERAARAAAGKPRAPRLSVVAVRGNTLSVMAKPLDLITVKRLVESFDVAPKAETPAEALVVPLRSAAAAEVARLLQLMYRADPAVQVAVGPGGNSLTVRAPIATRQEIEKLIHLLDRTAAGK